jgi:glycosyltransferase involved in cell wall biosynthesis
VFAYWRACRVIEREKIDAVFTTVPLYSAHVIGKWLKSRYGLPWIADYRDVWTVWNPPLQQNGEKYFYSHRRLEQKVLAMCDQVITISPPLSELTKKCFKTYLGSKTPITITNGVDLSDFTGASNTINTDDKFVISYIGTIQGMRANNSFPEGLRLALEQNNAFRSKVRMRFIGGLDPNYSKRLEHLGDNISILPTVDHKKAIEYMVSSDVLLLINPDNWEGQMAYTTKFFEYLAARRPILAVTPSGVISEIVRNEKIGLVAPPDNPQAIAQALFAMFKALGADPQCYCPSTALAARFDRHELTKQLADVLNQMVKK